MLDLSAFSCIQPMYSLVKRQAEVELLPLAQAERLGVVTYSPLGGGLLTGKYGVGKRPERGRLVENAMYRARYRETSYFETADGLIQYAETLGVGTELSTITTRPSACEFPSSSQIVSMDEPLPK